MLKPELSGQSKERALPNELDTPERQVEVQQKNQEACQNEDAVSRDSTEAGGVLVFHGRGERSTALTRHDRRLSV